MQDKVYLWNVEPSCSNVGCYQTLQFSLFETMKCYLSLLLGDVPVKGLGFLVEVGLEQDLVDLFFGFAEDDGSAMSAAVKVDEVSDD